MIPAADIQENRTEVILRAEKLTKHFLTEKKHRSAFPGRADTISCKMIDHACLISGSESIVNIDDRYTARA